MEQNKEYDFEQRWLSFQKILKETQSTFTEETYAFMQYVFYCGAFAVFNDLVFKASNPHITEEDGLRILEKLEKDLKKVLQS